jgi:hypothetical protein
MTAPTLNEIVTEMARYVQDSGFVVETAEAFSSNWVAIHRVSTEEDVFFLEFGDAEQFLLEAEAKAQEAGVDFETGLLAQAKSYIDCI